MMVELWSVSVVETEMLLATGDVGSIASFRGVALAPGALGPEIIWSSGLGRYRRGEAWFWCHVRLFYAPARQMVVGAGIFKNSPVDSGVEIGYGIAETMWNHGLATAAVGRMLDALRGRRDLTHVWGECSVDNPASGQVLRKNFFRSVGQRCDDEDGWLERWRCEL